MKPFQKTYYTDKFNITIRVKRDCFDSMGCRLTIKDRTKSFNGHLVRVLYTWFYNDKDMFRKLLRGMLDVKEDGMMGVTPPRKALSVDTT